VVEVVLGIVVERVVHQHSMVLEEVVLVVG
jgi:hypothetical protein